MKKAVITSSCSATEDALTKCPSCSNRGIKVNSDTIRKHLKKDIYVTVKSNKDDFNFCISPHCNTVYYANESREIFSQEEVKHKIAAKNQDLDTPLCYCKRLTKQDAIDIIESGEEDVSQKILDEIGDSCKCSKTNPKGVSCVEDISNFLTPYRIEFDTSKSNSSCCGTEEESNRSCCDTQEDSSSCCTPNSNTIQPFSQENKIAPVSFAKEKSSCC